MYQEEYFNPADPNDYENQEDAVAKAHREDRGLNTLTRKIQMDSGLITLSGTLS